MAAHWTYEGGRLIAWNETGAELRTWTTETDAMGQGMALLLNQACDLSRLLLWPLLE